jgi:hypothetical protein
VQIADDSSAFRIPSLLSGQCIAARMAMMAMTTGIVINVKPQRRRAFGRVNILCRAFKLNWVRRSG